MKLFILLESNWVLVGWMLLILVGCLGAFLLIAIIENATGTRHVNRRGNNIFTGSSMTSDYLEKKNKEYANSEQLKKQMEEGKKEMQEFEKRFPSLFIKEPTPEEIQIKENLKIGLSNIGKNYKTKP